MGVWVMGISSFVSAGLSLYNSRKQSKANKAALQWSKQVYNESKDYFSRQESINEEYWNTGIEKLSGNLPQASSFHATASLAEASLAESYDMEAFRAEAFRVEMDGFLASFKEATESADLSLDTFNRRYGQIMDNLQQSVLDVERERFSAQGREQLMLDADTMKKNLDDSIAKAGLARSGVTLEMQERMDMEIGRQARAIDVNSYAQAGQLQAQEVGTLGGLTTLREGIAARQEAIALGRGQGQLNASMQNAALKTQVSEQWAANQQQASSQNANNKTRVSLANAQNLTNVSMHNSGLLTNVSLANAASDTRVNMFNVGNAINTQNMIGAAYLNRGQSGFSAQNSFYSGMGQSGASGVSNAYNNQANSFGSAASGWAQFAGYTFGKATDSWYKAPAAASTGG